jgi:DNA-binding XRE family transcriptional regulator
MAYRSYVFLVIFVYGYGKSREQLSLWKGRSMAKSYNEIRTVMSEESRARAERETKRLLHEIRLAELREAANLTQTQLAERMGISQGAVSRIENGNRDLYLSTLARYVASTGGQLVVSAQYPDSDEVEIKVEAG